MRFCPLVVCTSVSPGWHCWSSPTTHRFLLCMASSDIILSCTEFTSCTSSTRTYFHFSHHFSLPSSVSRMSTVLVSRSSKSSPCTSTSFFSYSFHISAKLRSVTWVMFMCAFLCRLIRDCASLTSLASGASSACARSLRTCLTKVRLSSASTMLHVGGMPIRWPHLRQTSPQ